MHHGKLDKIDLIILASLQTNSRMSNAKLAHRLGISAPACLRRVQALEARGHLKGYHAYVDTKSLGFGITILAQVKLRSHADPDLKAFEAQVAGWPLVRESYMVAGDIDFLLKVVARDWKSYQEFLLGELNPLPNVARVQSILTIRATKNLPGVPIDIDEPTAAANGWGGLSVSPAPRQPVAIEP